MKKFGEERKKSKKEGEKEIKLWKDETYGLTLDVVGLRNKICTEMFAKSAFYYAGVWTHSNDG